eukprot:Nk52_evm8s288 gene=Nk52_evmTU8s288
MIKTLLLSQGCGPATSAMMWRHCTTRLGVFGWKKAAVVESARIGKPVSRMFHSNIHARASTALQMEDRHGYSLLHLPSKQRAGAPVSFVFKPHHSASQLCDDLQKGLGVEDGSQVKLFLRDGKEVAPSTPVHLLLMEPSFDLKVAEESFTVTPPALPTALLDDQEQDITDIKFMIQRLYNTLDVDGYAHERRRELELKLSELKDNLAPLEQQKTEIENIVEAKTNRRVWLGLGLMSVQFGIMARMTWWEYSWDIVEPISYFVTFGTGILGYAYFTLTKADYEYAGARERKFLQYFYKKSSSSGFDIQKYNDVKNAVADTERKIARLKHTLSS